MGETEDIKLASRVFEQCCSIKSQDLNRMIMATSLAASRDVVAPPSNLVNASNKFIKAITEQLVVLYCSLTESLQSK